MTETGTLEKRPPPLWLRLLPVAAILAGLAGAWAAGLFDYLSLDALKENRAGLQAFVAQNYLLAIAVFIGVYTLVTVCAVPGALWVTIAGGFLFGLGVGSAAVVFAATLGATLLFLAARTVLGDLFTRRAGPFLKKLEAGFKEDEALFLLTLRLAPIVPYPVANVAPALLGAKLSTFVVTTAIGIIPGVIAYAWIGAGLGAVLDAGGEPDVATLGRQLLPAFVALGALPLLAIAVRRFTAARKKAPA